MADPAVAEVPVAIPAAEEGLIAVELDIDTPEAPAAEVPPAEQPVEEAVEVVEPIETPAEETPAEETPAETVIEAVDNEADVLPIEPIDEPVAPAANDKLARFRKDKALDESLVTAELERAQNLANYHQRLNAHFAKDPLGKLHFFESLDRAGTLSESARKEMEYLRSVVKSPAATTATPAAPAALTADEVKVKVRKLITDGKEDEALELMSDFKAEQKIAVLRAELEPLKEKLTKAEQVEQAKADEAQLKRNAQLVREDIEAGCKAFPALMEVGPGENDVVKFKCETFKKGFTEMYARMPNASVKEIARQTLISQGRLRPGKGKPSTPGKPTVGTPVHAVAKAKPKAPQPKLGEIAIVLD